MNQEQTHSSRSAHESGLCRRLITVVYGEPFLSQVTRGDHIQHPGFSQASHTSASGLKVADYKTTPQRTGHNRLPTTKENTAPETSNCISYIRVVVQLLSHVRLFGTPWTAARQAFLSFAVSWSLLRLTFIKLMMPSNQLILCRPLLLLPSIFPSNRVFSNESALHIRWPKYWSFSLTS